MYLMFGTAFEVKLQTLIRFSEAKRLISARAMSETSVDAPDVSCKAIYLSFAFFQVLIVILDNWKQVLLISRHI